MAIINNEADATIVTGAVLTNVPMIYNLDQNPMSVIQTGDSIRVDDDR